MCSSDLYDYDADMIREKESSFKNEIAAITNEIADTDKEITRLNNRKKMLSSSTGNVEISDKELFEKNLKRIDVSTTVDYIKLEVVGIWNNIDIIYIDRKNVYQYYYHYIDVPIEVSYKDAIAHNLFRKEYKIERAARCSKKKGMN